MPKFHIDEVCTKDDLHPFIVNFQNGYTTAEFKTKECLLLKNKNTEKTCIATELDELVYAGEEDNEPLGKTLILAKNRKTSKVRIIEVTSAELKPILKIDNDAAQLLETSNLELSRKFGSKKHKQQMEQKEKLKINIQTVTEQMQNVTETITEEKLDLSSYNKNDSDDFYIPQINRLADKPEDVYDIDQILTEDQLEKIWSELEDKDYESDMFPFIRSLMSMRQHSQKHIVLAVYANSLLKLYLTNVKEISKKSFVACPHSAKLNDIILSSFTTMTNSRRCRPTQYKDKALCHAFVFVLLINKLKFELEGLCNDVKLTVNNASMKVRVTGAHVVNSGSKKVVQLKLPLNTKNAFRRKSARF